MADTKLSALASLNSLSGTDIVYAVSGGVSYSTTVDTIVSYARTNMYPQVATYADLPVSTGSGNIYIVQGSTGIWPLRKYAGFWRDTGSGWVWLGNATWVADEIGFTAAGNIAATTVSDALIELDTEKQPIDADLTAIAALTSAANKVPYSTGAQAWALADFTAAGRALVDDADAAAQRATLGLVIGTNVQAYDADLTTYASITPSANVQSLLGAANYAAMKTLLAIANTDVSGLGTASTKDVATAANIQAGTTNKVVIADTFITAAAPQTLTDQATITWDMHAGFNAKVTLGGNRTLATPTNPHVGLTYALGIIQDGTGSRTLTWPSSTIIDWGSAGAPTLSTGAGKRDLVFLYCYDDSTPSFRATFNKAA